MRLYNIYAWSKLARLLGTITGCIFYFYYFKVWALAGNKHLALLCLQLLKRYTHLKFSQVVTRYNAWTILLEQYCLNNVQCLNNAWTIFVVIVREQHLFDQQYCSCNIYRMRKRSLPQYQNTEMCVENWGRRPSFLTTLRCFSKPW